jgi:polyhydroxyalkanoate synthesis regulator phasin
MNEEQMQNTMQFIIEHQARFAVDMQATQEAIEAMKEHSRQTDDRIRTLADALLSLGRITEENARAFPRVRREDRPAGGVGRRHRGAAERFY